MLLENPVCAPESSPMISKAIMSKQEPLCVLAFPKDLYPKLNAWDSPPCPLPMHWNGAPLSVHTLYSIIYLWFFWATLWKRCRRFKEYWKQLLKAGSLATDSNQQPTNSSPSWQFSGSSTALSSSGISQLYTEEIHLPLLIYTLDKCQPNPCMFTQM